MVGVAREVIESYQPLSVVVRFIISPSQSSREIYPGVKAHLKVAQEDTIAYTVLLLPVITTWWQHCHVVPVLGQ